MSVPKYRVTFGGKRVWRKGKRTGIGPVTGNTTDLLSASQAAKQKRQGDRLGVIVRSVPVLEGATVKRKGSTSTKRKGKKKGKPSKAEFLRRMRLGRLKAARKRKR